MNYEEFKNEFVDALQEHLYEGGNEVSIHVNTVEKMNETYEAITITPAGSNIGMNLNLEVFAEGGAEAKKTKRCKVDVLSAREVRA